MSVKTLKLELYHSNINITLAAAQQGTVDDLISNQIRLLWTMMMNERTTGQVNTNYKAPLLLSFPKYQAYWGFTSSISPLLLRILFKTWREQLSTKKFHYLYWNSVSAKVDNLCDMDLMFSCLFSFAGKFDTSAKNFECKRHCRSRFTTRKD